MRKEVKFRIRWNDYDSTLADDNGSWTSTILINKDILHTVEKHLDITNNDLGSWFAKPDAWFEIISAENDEDVYIRVNKIKNQ